MLNQFSFQEYQSSDIYGILLQCVDPLGCSRSTIRSREILHYTIN